MPAAPCGSARKARARCRGRPATAMAANAATVTDANVVLGYLDASAFMGGARPLDVAAAEAAVDRVAASLGLARLEAAAGIFRMINLKMADGIRLMTLRRGVDPRKLCAAQFRRRGGPACRRGRARTRHQAHHRADRRLGAVGLGHADQRSALRSQPHPLRRRRRASRRTKREACLPIWSAQATGRLRAWFGGPMTTERSAEMRYGEQIFEIDVALDGLDWNAASLVDAIEDRFHRRHEELYTYASRDQEVVFVNARVAAIGEVSQRGQDTRPAPSAAACAPRGNAAGLVRAMARGSGLCARRSAARPHSGGARDHRGRDHDGGRQCRRPGDRQRAGLAGYRAAVIGSASTIANGAASCRCGPANNVAPSFLKAASRRHHARSARRSGST